VSKDELSGSGTEPKSDQAVRVLDFLGEVGGEAGGGGEFGPA
jgi:hypothetical protein